jgi:transcriptional regulator with XRE-family HTH domain
MKDTELRPSQVFAVRLRELRNQRGYSQADLARLMQEAGRPVSKVAVLRIEKGERGLTLDEAIAFARVLGAVPAHMLSPRDEGLVWITGNQAVDGEGMRAWLRTGEPLGGFQEELRSDLEQIVMAHAQALVDAMRGDDAAGKKAALVELGKTALDYQDALMDLERRGFTEAAIAGDSEEGSRG